VKEFATAKFNETVDCAVNLGIDASKSDQQVRGSTVMPHGTARRCASRCSPPARTSNWRRPRVRTSSAWTTSPRR
jgi:hypothetical protein